MSQCRGFTRNGQNCSRTLRDGEIFCWQHREASSQPVVPSIQPVVPFIQPVVPSIQPVTQVKISGKRLIGNLNLFSSNDSRLWEDEYTRIMEKEYAKNTRNFSINVTGKAWTGQGQPPIFLIPRERGGPSYKSVQLQGVTSDDVFYAPISKGFTMQDVSSFTLGPIIGEGLCLVNAAFSKCICIMHIERGGQIDLSRKNFWRRTRTSQRIIQVIDSDHINVDNQLYNTKDWLKANEHLWLEQWELWRKCIAMSSRGDFHWIALI